MYAHGYVPPDAALALPVEATSLAGPLQRLGYAFATTSYRTNGLAVIPAQADLLELVRLFEAAYGVPGRVFLVGFSEGGLITTLAVEQYPEIFAGGLAMCGPVGSFRAQIDYFVDFRVVFDAFFPGLLPGDPVQVPQELSDRWEAYYRQNVLPRLQDPVNRSRLEQLLTVTGAAYDPIRPATIEQTIRGALGYNAFATNDARAQLGGQPFDNQARVYSGSADDAWLNQAVRRITSEPAALEALADYETSGNLLAPLVTMHTSGDEIVPAFHLEQYRQKVGASGSTALHESILVERYGHCSFTNEEVLNAFALLIRIADQPILLPTITPSTRPTLEDRPATVQPGRTDLRPNPAAGSLPEITVLEVQEPETAWEVINNWLARLANRLHL